MVTDVWSDRWPDHLWLERFRRRCRRDRDHGITSFQSSLAVSSVPRPIPKRLWLYWSQGWQHAPTIVRDCRTSWVSHNPDWEITFLDQQTEFTYCDIGLLVKGKSIDHAARSDLLRLALLCQYGGVWADATTYCASPLSQWLPQQMQSGFFGYSKPGPDRLLSTWLLASERHGWIVERWFALARRYWRLVDKADYYFWAHYLFAEGCRNDPKMRSLWATTPHVAADGSHRAQAYLRRGDTARTVNILNKSQVKVHKLSKELILPNLRF